ncbi:CrcB family protein [Zhihengliuella sp.]|uniref:fluoride efflux transporter FluC n=1 Tax=Zhihengliuella sp. TaxID=1954483 RepID=UPI00281239DA|nr:CrcB family protein [Zhihengliuella sp.]
MTGRPDFRSLLAVGAGGFAGTLARLGLSVAYDDAAHLPWGTLAANAAGCLVLGLLTGWWQASGRMGERWRLALGGGFLGSFTTFSAVAVMLPGVLSLPGRTLPGPSVPDPGVIAGALGWTLGMALVCCLLAAAGLAIGSRHGAARSHPTMPHPATPDPHTQSPHERRPER